MFSKPLIRSYSSYQMLELWRLVRHFEPLAEEVSLARTDALDTERMLREEIDRWYALQYATLPHWQLPHADIADITPLEILPDGTGVATLPERCMHLREVWIEGWAREAQITDQSSALAARQSSPFLRGGLVDPVAVVSDHGTLRLYTPPAGATAISRLVAVVWPEPGQYLITPYMLPEIFD